MAEVGRMGVKMSIVGKEGGNKFAKERGAQEAQECLYLPSLHSRATRDSRLSICICSRFSVRSLSRDLRL